MQRELGGTWELGVRVTADEKHTSRFQFHATNPHNAVFQLYKRICLWIWHDLNGSIKGRIFHVLIFFPHLSLNLKNFIQYCKFNLHWVWCQFLWKELLHVTDTQLKYTAEYNICRTNSGTNRCHLSFAILYVSFTSSF